MDLNINLGLLFEKAFKSLSEKQQLLIAPHCLWCRCRCRWRQVGGSVGHCTSSDGEAGNTCGHGLEDLCLITHNRCITGGALIYKDLAYPNSSHTQDEANATVRIRNTITFHPSEHILPDFIIPFDSVALWLCSVLCLFSPVGELVSLVGELVSPVGELVSLVGELVSSVGELAPSCSKAGLEWLLDIEPVSLWLEVSLSWWSSLFLLPGLSIGVLFVLSWVFCFFSCRAAIFCANSDCLFQFSVAMRIMYEQKEKKATRDLSQPVAKGSKMHYECEYHS